MTTRLGFTLSYDDVVRIARAVCDEQERREESRRVERAKESMREFASDVTKMAKRSTGTCAHQWEPWPNEAAVKFCGLCGQTRAV